MKFATLEWPLSLKAGVRTEGRLSETATNDTNYGLQAYVFSADDQRARELARRIEAGRVLVNTLAHEPAAPFGGFKQSGINREYGTFWLEAFLELKAVLTVS